MAFKKGKDNPGFKPGQSGNPGGKPKALKDVIDYAREHTLDAMNALIEIMKNEDHDPRARVKAAEVIIDRGWGKAPQHVKISGEVEIGTWEENVARAHAARKKAEGEKK